ncbi:ABC transporter substrate-binding protein [Paenibacillus oryzisoli]|uniref:ABC transporter substrate-binding protein n=1 Tax=Paenibacillus oryzisoli TaxID=1850517 RepID=A0A197ZW65_9BACL|nr:extracellular solute-binding protein [Paenibacillus oryzisoli]OAS13275.1 hypothetical protein A8708_10785 [Paenibacillus oryzisoli]
MNKLSSITTVCLLSIGLLAGCSSSKTESTATVAPTSSEVTPVSTSKVKKDITLTYIASQDWVKDGEMKLAKKFEAETGIHIDYQIIPADQYTNILKTKLNAQEAPDIFGGQSGKSDIVTQYNVEKNAVDLSGEEWVKREDPLSIEQASVNGKVYALTVWDNTGSWIINYNKQIFQKLGLSIPKTYSEFKSISQKIKDSGITPIYEPISDGWHHVLWFPEIGPRFEEVTPGLTDRLNTNKAKFADDPTMLLALTQLQEMNKLGFFGTNAFSDTFADTEKNMASGKFAMTLNNPSEPANIEKAYPEMKADNFGFFVMPLADNQILNVNPAAPSKFIYSGSQHIAEAKQYFAFLAKQENLQAFLDSEPKFSTLNFPNLKDKFTPEQKKFFETYKKAGTVFQTSINYLNAQWMDIGKELQAMLGSTSTPADVLKSIDKKRESIAKAAKDPAW